MLRSSLITPQLGSSTAANLGAWLQFRPTYLTPAAPTRRAFLRTALLAGAAIPAAALGCHRTAHENTMTPDTSDLEHTVLPVNGLRFDALSAGPRTGALVLLLHGFPQFADSWAPILRSLAAHGYRAVAVDQRGYSPGARPSQVDQYSAEHLDADLLGFADALHAPRFHLVGHDWGGLLAWRAAALHPQRLLSLGVLSTPHPDAFLEALSHNPDQINRSKYILLFRAPGHLAETALLAAHARGLRNAYAGKLPEAEVESNIRRLSNDNTLTAALNWYRALDMHARIGPASPIRVPSLYIWGDQDQALGESAALATASYVQAPYRFERLAGKSHWLLEDATTTVTTLLTDHLQAHAA